MMEERILWPELESEEAFRKFMEETPSLRGKSVPYEKWWEEQIKEEGEEYPLSDEAFFINRTMDPLAQIFEDEEEAEAFQEADVKLQEAMEKGEGLKEAHRAYRAGLFGMLIHINPLWSVGKDLLAMWSASQRQERSVYRLGKEDYALFEELATEEQAALIGKKGYTAFGAVLPDEKTGEETAAALLILSDKEADEICPDRRVELEWLFTAPAFRGRHAADELMAALYEYCAENDIFLVRADVPSMDFLPVYFVPYLMKWHIILAAEEEPELLMALRDMDGKGIPECFNQSRDVKSLEHFSKKEITAFLHEQNAEQAFDPDDLDKTLSCAVMSDGKICRLLPVKHRAGDAIEVGYALYDKNLKESDVAAMYYHVLDLAMEHYPASLKVLFSTASEEEAAALDRAFPKHSIPMHYRGINVLDPEEEDWDIDMDDYDFLRTFYYFCREGGLKEIMAKLDIPRDTEALNPYEAVLMLMAEDEETEEEEEEGELKKEEQKKEN